MFRCRGGDVPRSRTRRVATAPPGWRIGIPSMGTAQPICHQLVAADQFLRCHFSGLRLARSIRRNCSRATVDTRRNPRYAAICSRHQNSSRVESHLRLRARPGRETVTWSGSGPPFLALRSLGRNGPGR